jgi:3-phytase
MYNIKSILLFSIVVLCGSFFFASCKPTPKNTDKKQEQLTEEDLEAREDSIELANAYAAQAKIEQALYPSVETALIKAGAEEDAADDPAIWVNPADPSKSLIYGSNKQGGLAVYKLEGEEIAYYPLGKINNVDVLYNHPLGDSIVSLVGCSNRTDQSIDIMKINPSDGSLKDVAAHALKVDATLIDDVYGFCFAKLGGRAYAIVNGKNGVMQQFEMINLKETIDLKLVRQVEFDGQTEGMVADNELGYLYVGEENRGVWKLHINPADTTKTIITSSEKRNNPNIDYDIEGLSIYKQGKEGYLIASSQGNFSYAVFDRGGDNAYIRSFKIVGKDQIDGSEETDGLDIVSDSLSPAYPKGLLVVQDGFNYDGDSLRAQNFKLVSWEQFESMAKEDGIK